MLGYVAPVTVALDRGEDHGKKDSFEYIPVSKTITALPKLKEHYKALDITEDSKLLQDVCDGQLFRNKNVFNNGRREKSVALQLYFDEFEVCNPIGSKRGVHKLLALYFTLLNTSTKCRSRTSDKHLVLFVKSATEKEHGPKKNIETTHWGSFRRLKLRGSA